jgi:Tol biopolymer transport system component
MKLERFDALVWGILGLIGLTVVGVILLGDQVGARLVGTRPEPDGSVSATGQVVIEFAQAMNQASVESGFSLEPTLSGRFIWQNKTLTFVPAQPFQRHTTYTAQVAQGVLAANGQAVKQTVTWRFTVREPAIIYIAPASEARELWSLTPGQEARPLTATGGAIYDYAVSPDGEQVAYSVANEKGGLDLWVMNRDGSTQRVWVECAADRCSAPNWSPAGNRLAYSRETEGLTPGGPHGPPRVWILETDTGQTTPLYQESQLLGSGPSWSPDGQRLAAWDGSLGSIRVLNLQTNETMLLPSQSGAPGTWSPDGATMLFNDLSLVGELPYVKMYLAEFATKQIRPAFNDETQLTDYSVPVWSPDGVWVAAGIKTPSSGLGSQLWILHPDGTGGRAIADDPQYTYGAYRWSPWSDSLIFQRFELGLPFAKPEILIWSAADNSVKPVVSDASLPAWLP